MEGKTKINLDEKENIVRKGINFSPNKHLAPCSMTQRKTNDTCIEHRECFEAEWENGCWSSHCLKDGKHYLSQINPENVVKNRCYFLVSRHPDRNLYVSGLIFVSKTEPDREGGNKGWVYGESIPFEPGVVKWTGHYRGEEFISNRRALKILKEYYDKTKDRKVEEIIKVYEEGELPSVAGNLEETFYSLDKSKQIIFYGPPGTGKTYKAREFAVEFLEESGGH